MHRRGILRFDPKAVEKLDPPAEHPQMIELEERAEFRRFMIDIIDTDMRKNTCCYNFEILKLSYIRIAFFHRIPIQDHARIFRNRSIHIFPSDTDLQLYE